MPGKTIKVTDVKRKIRDVRRELRAVEAATEAHDTMAAYAAAERAQHASFDLKDMFGIDTTKLLLPAEPVDTQCTASSWQSQTHRPYGPGGYNRCKWTAEPDHEQHKDDFGNVFEFNPDAAGGSGDPRVKVLRNEGDRR